MKKLHITKLLSRFGLAKTVAVTLGLTAVTSAWATVAYDFAATPLYLQSTTTTSSTLDVKPNVMLFVDDSGSMTSKVSGTSSTRTQVVQSVLTSILNTYQDQFNWGLRTLHNNNSANLSGFTDGTSGNNYETVITQVGKLGASGVTPTTSRYYSVVENIVKPAIEYRCQKSYVVLMSDGDANSSCSTVSGQRVVSWFTNTDYYGTQTSGTCVDYKSYVGSSLGYYTNYVISGYYYGNNFHTFWDVNTGLSFLSDTLASKDIKSYASDGTDAAGKSWDGDAGDPGGASTYSNQLIDTFTVGFGSDISDDGASYLKQGASSDDYYFSATSSDDLLSAFESIFSSISAATTSTNVETTGSTSPATASTGLSDLAATVYVDTGSWSSQLRFYSVNSDGTYNTTSYTQPYFDNRKTLINTGNGVYWADDVTDENVDNSFFGITTASNENEWKNALLPWTVRSTSVSDSTIAAQTGNSQTYRVRESGERDLGDILDGSVAAIGDETAYGNAEFLAAASNDGMVHLFQSTSSSYPYELRLSYLPAAMDREDVDGSDSTSGKMLKYMANENYGSSIAHRYGVNGGFVLRRTSGDSDGDRKTFMFGSMGQGGRGAYALNVGALADSSESDWNDDVPMFETAKGDDNALGYTIGSPQIGRVSISRNSDQTASIESNVRYAGFLGSGYRVQAVSDSSNETALYVYEMLGLEMGSGSAYGTSAGTVGEVLAKITVSDGVGGLSQPTLVDADFDGLIDVAYAGDRGGNMYRFDLRGTSPSKWTVNRIYQGSTSQPITSAPAVSRRSANKYVVIFGTGSDVYQDDLENTDQQAVYGIYDDLTADASDATADDLLEQTMTVSDGYVYLTNDTVGSSQKGWMFNLTSGTGERVVVKPTMILRTAVITTRTYTTTETSTTASSTDKCLPASTTTATTGTTSIIGVNALNGGALSSSSARFTTYTYTLNGATYYANGYANLSGIVSFTYVSSAKTSDSAVTADGDSGGSGTDSDLTTSGSAASNQCFVSGSTNTMLLNTLGNYTVTGRTCGLRRISWREIFS
ncbi:PilC family type IV pilus tip adhesin [Neisseria perflava]|uniref:PilC family type IV pilus tip adhesin n=1 Tax=Neisseria perflava TaxID=33053 RepID=UPI00209DC58A|nr:PilC family type IV pilus tip adhesin [Neisseria perflava]MCP1660758.1 type IV pilus assembly protein PilY1 [Neisseria perflava]